MELQSEKAMFAYFISADKTVPGSVFSQNKVQGTYWDDKFLILMLKQVVLQVPPWHQ